MSSAVVALATAVFLVVMPASGRADPAPARVHRDHRLVSAPRARVARRHVAAIYRRGDEIVAPGGFSAHGYGYPFASAADRRAIEDEDFRRGLYDDRFGADGFGFDGLGGAAFENNRSFGFDGPFLVP